jgi:hypothetical protein
MQRGLQIIEGTPTSGLPILATANDVREVVQLLKKRPEGVTVAEASDATRRRLFDPRKVAAYELWGVISRSGDRIKLSGLGREFADRLGPEAQLYRVLLDRTPPYRALLEWVHGRRLEVVTHAEIVGYWQEHFPGALRRGERTAGGHVLSFLQLCHAAEIGVATVGRKGQPSRLRIDRDELAAHLQAPSRPTLHLAEAGQPTSRQPPRPRPAAPARPRVFISALKGAAVAARVRDALQVADIASEVVERGTGDGGLISERTCEAMRRCGVGIIALGRGDYETGVGGEAALRQDALVEIGAACVYYARRLVLLRAHGLRLPRILEGFCQYELDGDELTWETGLHLVRTVKHFISGPSEETAIHILPGPNNA